MITPPKTFGAKALPARGPRGQAARILHKGESGGLLLHSTIRQRPRAFAGRTLGRRPDLDGFLGRLASAPRRGLLIDYDGTLAPLIPDRRKAIPYPGVRAALATIALAARPTSIWIVSGRAVADLATMIRLDRFVDLWGSHGAERRTRNGCWVGPAPSRAAGDLLDRAARTLRDLGAGALVERKLYGLALHGRGADRELYLAARRAFVRGYLRPAEEEGLHFAAFDGGIELRPEEFDKGRTVERAFMELGDDAAIAYLGDDATDEDAFAVLGDRGLPVLVAPRPRPTFARAWLVPPAEVLGFLTDWGAACSRGGAA